MWAVGIILLELILGRPFIQIEDLGGSFSAISSLTQQLGKFNEAEWPSVGSTFFATYFVLPTDPDNSAARSLPAILQEVGVVAADE